MEARVAGSRRRWTGEVHGADLQCTAVPCSFSRTPGRRSSGRYLPTTKLMPKESYGGVAGLLSSQHGGGWVLLSVLSNAMAEETSPAVWVRDAPDAWVLLYASARWKGRHSKSHGSAPYRPVTVP